MSSIGENIRVLRLAKGWTQEQLAGQLHVTRQAVSHYESGRTVPDIDTCRRLSALFGVELEVVLEGEDESAPTPRWIPWLTLGTAGLFPLVRSVMMVVNQRLYPVSLEQINLGNLPEAERLALMNRHIALSRAANAVETAGYTAFFAVLVVLVLWELRQRKAATWRQKLILWGLVAAVSVAVTLPLSFLDPVFGPVDYLFPAAHNTVRFGIALLAAWGIRRVQKR